MAAGQTSGTNLFLPSVADLVVQAYRRIQVFPPQLLNEHIVAARMALNLVLLDISANRGIDLWSVDQINIPLIPGVGTYTLPANTVDLLDVYLRTFTPGTAVTTVGNVLTPLVLVPGQPTLGAGGEPTVLAPGSGVFSVTAGSQVVTMNWPAHGQVPGNPIFWQYPVLAGPQTLPSFVIVDSVIDSNTLTFLLSTAATNTRPGVGGTPLFTTTAASTTVTVVQSGHGLSVGETYPVTPNLTVGGVTLSGSYTVASVVSPYEFTITIPSAAASTATAFLNQGQIAFTTQTSGVVFTDIPLFPLSRNDYAALPYKNQPGRPTSYWLNRVVPPNISTYPVAPTPNAASSGVPVPNLQNPAVSNTVYYGFMAYRMREIQDAVPSGGQILDAPKRIWPAITAELCAAVAEIYAPAQWMAKQAAAKIAWDRAALADVERATTHLVPNFSFAFR